MAAEIPRPLTGMRVIEMGAVIAAPFCAALLAELGAEVIKIERPDGGDPFRSMGPSVRGVQLWWGVASRNKRCVALDLKNPADKRRFQVLVAGADIFVENNRPGALDRLGLGWAALSVINPRLVMLSISGFGQTGPYAPRPGFGKIAEAMSGQVALTGQPSQTPFHVGFSLADTSAGLSGLFGLAVALFLRDKVGTGSGVHIDIGLYEPLLRMVECQFALLDRLGQPATRGGSNHPYAWGQPTNGNGMISCFRCQDHAWIAVYVDADADAALQSKLGIDRASLADWLAGRDCGSALAALTTAGIAATRVHDGLTLAKDGYFQDRGDVKHVLHEEFKGLAAPGFTPQAYATAGLHVFRTPTIGEADAEVFATEPAGATQ